MTRLSAALVAGLQVLAALALLVLMAVVAVDVGGRSLFDRPLPWGTELLEVVLGAMIFCAYPLLALAGSHITVDLIRVRPSLRRVQRVLAAVLGFVLFVVIAWCVGRQAIRSLGYGDASPLLQIPTGEVLWCMTALAVVTAVAFLLGLRRSLAQAAAPSSLPVE